MDSVLIQTRLLLSPAVTQAQRRRRLLRARRHVPPHARAADTSGMTSARSLQTGTAVNSSINTIMSAVRMASGNLGNAVFGGPSQSPVTPYPSQSAQYGDTALLSPDVLGNSPLSRGGSSAATSGSTQVAWPMLNVQFTMGWYEPEACGTRSRRSRRRYRS